MARGDSPVHAVLLYGAEGSGKTELSRILAKAWLCTNPGEEGACGECRTCAAFGRDRCADFQSLGPWGPSRLIKMHAVRDLPPEPTDPFLGIAILRFFNMPALMARTKVVILNEADRMNDKANNALLKTLEEPPPYGKLILTTTSVGQIPPTILSRCLALACELPLASELGDLTEAESLLSGGSPGIVKRIRSRPEVYDRLTQFAASLAGHELGAALALSDEFRDLCAEIGKADDLNTRAANTEGLKLLATALSKTGAPAAWIQATAEAHRRIQGNAGAGHVFDALFSAMV